MHDDGHCVGGDDTDHAARAQTVANSGEYGSWVVNDLEHAVANRHIEGPASDDLEQVGGIALNPEDALADVRLGSTAFERRK